jgi:hypothetical protein
LSSLNDAEAMEMADWFDCRLRRFSKYRVGMTAVTG